MDLDQIIADTKAAFAEEGVDDPDLSYLTMEYVEESLASAVQDPTPEDYAAAGVEHPQEEAARGCNLVYNAWFNQAQMYYSGNVASTSTCNSNWRISGHYSSRHVVTRCLNNSRFYIWRVC